MEGEQFRAAETLFHRALARPTGAREQFLRDACGGDESLRVAVARLIEAEADAESRLAGVVRRKVVEMAPELAHDGPQKSGHEDFAGDGRASLALSQRIGPYRLLGKLGQGGQGIVLLAERDDDAFRMKVAIKLLRHGVDTPAQHARFRRERQILARLEHPAIARVLDGGTADDGAPYVVMEYVEGQPIDRYCQQQNLGVAAILALFCRAAQAVEAAHRQLVIHRDLKPSNLLVTEDGTPKLLDFGISQLLVEDDPLIADLTTTGRRPLTPSFASPEQLRGDRLTTATDVYSLGVLLFLLLTGEQPFHLAGHSAAEIERIVVEREARAPSELAARAGDAALSRKLRGDLDTIVLKALRKEPEQRYVTVAELVDDIHRYQHGLPVRARPETMRYRLGKFLVRHRLSVAAATLTALGFLTLVGFYTLRLRAERDRAGLEALRADRRAAEAQAITRLVIELFELADPNESGGEAVTARQLLEHGVELTRRIPDDQPALRGRLLGFLAEVHLQLELYDQARALLDDRLNLARGHASGPNHELAATLASLGKLELDRHQFAEADRFLGQALAAWRAFGEAERVGDGSKDLLQTRLFLIELRQAQDLPEQDGGRERELAEIRRVLQSRAVDEHARLPAGHPELVRTQRLLAESLSLDGDQAFYDNVPERAVERYRETLAIRQQILGPLHLDVAETWNNLALALAEAGQSEESLSARQRSFEIHRQLLGNESIRMAIGLGNLGTFQLSRGAAKEALEAYRQALAMTRALRGDHHPNVAWLLRGTGYAWRELGEIERAASAFRESVDLVRHNVEHGYATQWGLADALYRQGVFALRQGHSDTARAALRECADLRRAERPEAGATSAAECLAQSLQTRGSHTARTGAQSLIDRCTRAG